MKDLTLPFHKEQIEQITQTHPTPFHIYDEQAIRLNVRRLQQAFSWAPKFIEYFAVKATPNPYIMKLLADEMGVPLEAVKKSGKNTYVLTNKRQEGTK